MCEVCLYVSGHRIEERTLEQRGSHDSLKDLIGEKILEVLSQGLVFTPQDGVIESRVVLVPPC